MKTENKRCLSDRAKAVKKELIERGMTQRELAKVLGVNANYLTDVLAGRKPGNKYWGKIAEVLHLDFE